MRLPFGLQIVRMKAAATAVPSNSGWWPLSREPYTGAWQRNDSWTTDTVVAYHAVYACVTLIASDVGKLRPKLVQQDGNGIWTETFSPAFSPVLRKPNGFQNHIQFKEWWTTSKLLRGNAYALKQRDARGVVTALYLLDPTKVTPLIADDGSVYYQLGADNLAQQPMGLTVPASEIIHDRINCLFHPLVGVSPIFASGLAANIGLHISENSSAFFKNGSNPSGMLTAPNNIPTETAKRLQQTWEANYSGDNSGKVAVAGNGLTFVPLRMTAVDAQMIEQLRWTAETVCSTFHVPAFKVGIGTMPTYQNGQTLNGIYYSDCLQSHVESWELCMDEGLGLGTPLPGGKQYGVELDIDSLLRMDSATQMETLAKGVGSGILKPDEARKALDKPPTKGGDTPYLQEQNYSLAALAKRDAKADPWASAKPDPVPPQPPPDNQPPDNPPPTDEGAQQNAAVISLLERRTATVSLDIRTLGMAA